MARYNEILVGRFNRFLQKYLQMKGEPPAPQLSSEIQPGFVFFHGRENRYLEGWNTYQQHFTAGPTALNQSGLRLRMPKTAGVIAIIEMLSIACFAGEAAQAEVHGGTATVDLANVISAGSGQRLDGRGQQAASLVASTQSSAVTVPVLTGDTDRWRIAVGASFTSFAIETEDQEFPIVPGDAVQLVQNPVNIVLRVSVMWRERALEESEAT